MSRFQSLIRAVLVTSMVVLATSACGMDDDAMASSMARVPADASGPGVPEGVAQFAVDPFWPQPLPNNWIIG